MNKIKNIFYQIFKKVFAKEIEKDIEEEIKNLTKFIYKKRKDEFMNMPDKEVKNEL